MNRKLLFSISVLITMSSLLVSINSAAQDQSQDDQPPVPKETTIASVPALAEIIPLEIELSGRLVTLQNEINGLLDVSEVENEYADFEKTLAFLVDQLNQFKVSKDPRYSALIELDKSLDKSANSFDEISAPLLLAIGQLGSWRTKWLKEQRQWIQWQDSLSRDVELAEIELTFANAHKKIEKALNLILPQLDVMLRLQKKGYKNKTILVILKSDIDEMKRDYHQNLLTITSPPIFSSEFSAQFSGKLWNNIKIGFSNIEWPDRQFFARELWVILLQVIVTFFSIVFIYRKRPGISKMERYAFVARYPVSAGLFLGVMTTIVIYQFHNAPGIWNMIIVVIGGLSFARIVSAIKKSSWKNHFVYALIILLIITQLLDLMRFPPPLYRVFLILVSVASIIFCFKWAAKDRHRKGGKYYAWLLYLISLVYFVIIIAEIIGEKNLAIYIFGSLLRTIVNFLILVMLMYLIRGGVEMLFRDVINKALKATKHDNESSVNQILFFINAVIVIFIMIPATLFIWGLYDNIQAANVGLMNLGFNLGEARISIGLILTAVGILYVSYIISIVLQYLLMNNTLSKKHIDKGARLSITRLLNYFILFIGFLIAISALGFDITKLTIILSALGVGIGFGLQGFVNNFISGLILLFEQPVREGDSIQVGGDWSTIKRIGLRATRVKTADEADVIIPNADLVYNQVTNWTLSNRHVRIIIKVGVAYGSDIALVIETLIEVAKANNSIVKEDVTQALFVGFGDSTLNFELRVWANEANDRIQLMSDLHQDIDRRFRESKIEIAFPQIDLHVRSADKTFSINKDESNK